MIASTYKYISFSQCFIMACIKKILIISYRCRNAFIYLLPQIIFMYTTSRILYLNLISGVTVNPRIWLSPGIFPYLRLRPLKDLRSFAQNFRWYYQMTDRGWFVCLSIFLRSSPSELRKLCSLLLQWKLLAWSLVLTTTDI